MLLYASNTVVYMYLDRPRATALKFMDSSGSYEGTPKCDMKFVKFDKFVNKYKMCTLLSLSCVCCAPPWLALSNA